MSAFLTLLSDYFLEFLGVVLTALAGYLGMTFKRLYEKYVTDREKAEVAEICVRATEQLYGALSGEEKLEKALRSASEMFAARGIGITDTELRLLIESAVAKFKGAFEKPLV